VPALLLPGPTVVVSPLLALQHDQVAALLERSDEVGGAVGQLHADDAPARAGAR